MASYGARYWDRTSDLCRVNAKPLPPAIKGYDRIPTVAWFLTTGCPRSPPVICGGHVVAAWPRELSRTPDERGGKVASGAGHVLDRPDDRRVEVGNSRQALGEGGATHVALLEQGSTGLTVLQSSGDRLRDPEVVQLETPCRHSPGGR